MFDIIFGYRLLLKNKIQSLVIMSGLALLCAILVVVSALTPSILSQKPTWINSESRHVTVGVTGHDQRMQPSSIARLEQLQQLPGVANISYLGQINTPVRVAGKTVTASIILIDFQLLQKSNLVKSTNDIHFQQQVYISKDFARQFSHALPGEYLTLEESNLALEVAGYLPDSLHNIGIWQADILLSVRHFSGLVKVNFANGKLETALLNRIKNQLAREMPSFIGIAELTSGYTMADIAAHTPDKRENTGNLSLSTNIDNLAPYFFPGIEFAPEAKKQLLRQWWLLLILAISFAVMNSLNLLTMNFSKLLERTTELRLRLSVGAHYTDIMRQLAAENLCLIAISGALGLALAAGTFWLTQNMLPELHLSSGIMIFAMLLAVVLIGTLVLLSAWLPMFSILRDNLFNRSKSQQSTLIGRWLSKINVTFQILVAGVVLSLACGIFSAQWLSLSNINLDTSIQQWSVIPDQTSGERKHLLPKTLWQQLQSENAQVALSQDNTIKPDSLTSEISLYSPDEPTANLVNLLSVSSNYFQLLGVSFLSGTSVAEQRVVINNAAAHLLGFPNPDAAINQRLFIRNAYLLGLNEQEPIFIAGIIENLPHFGTLNKHTPMLYADIAMLKQTPAVTVLVNPAEQHTLYNGVNSLITANDPYWSLNFDGSIQQQLQYENRYLNQLTLVALTLATLLSALAGFSLYYQINADALQQQTRFGIMIAVGASGLHILKLLMSSLASAFIVAVSLLAVLLLIFQASFRVLFTEYSVSLLQLLVVIAMLSIIMVLSCIKPFIKTLHNSAASLIRGS
ncbi:FtsX-like permease family protein [Rheinheimera sp. D18]|uniref:ABC transporter permease n=1 Tax=Rheinheimera sp. D18 TaxID=2545632 RepID=UPI001050545B|nr:FtsX-like permease family protein [Rheinheimera sp. D18]QBL08016.1 FtsX-like permease family protein [Rheinheimera sp. D18]